MTKFTKVVDNTDSVEIKKIIRHLPTFGGDRIAVHPKSQ